MTRLIHISFATRVVILATAVFFVPPAEAADRASGLRSSDSTPIAPRGGVMMLPLTADRPGDRWPRRLELSLADGRSVSGVVVWIHRLVAKPDAAPTNRWTADPSGLAVRAIRTDDDSSDRALGTPFLLARLPEDGSGPIRLGGRELAAIWRSPHEPYTEAGLPDATQPRLELEARFDRPDPASPFEYWRWMLLADRLGLNPPDTQPYGTIDALVAEHYAALWRIGLARLAATSPAVASTCRDLLTRTADDDGTSFAAWVAAPELTGPLLARLLDLDAPEDRVTRDALAWGDARGPLLAWREAEYGDSVRIALVNRGFTPLVAKLSWRVAGDVPAAVALPPGRLTRVEVDRPPPVAPDASRLVARDEAAPAELLEVTVDGQTVRLPFGARVIPVAPPGAVLAPFRRPLELAILQRRIDRNVTLASATSLHVRRRMDRWEAFFECRRPGSSTGASSPGGRATREQTPGNEPLAGFSDAAAIRDVDAVVLIVGGEADPIATLAVAEHGAHRLFTGRDDGTLEIHRRSYNDRWYCRIVLPDAWLSPPETEPTFVSLASIRVHGETNAVEMAPASGPPWRRTPAPGVFELGVWDRER